MSRCHLLLSAVAIFCVQSSGRADDWADARKACDSHDFVRGIALYTKVLQANPGNVQALCERANAHGGLGDFAAQIQDCTQAIQLRPDYASPLVIRGNAYLVQRNPRRALADYTEALRLQPDNADTYNSRGGAHLLLGHYHAAISDFSQAIRLRPDEVFAYENRGTAYGIMGNYRQELADNEKAIEIDPTSYLAKMNLANVLATCPDAKMRDGKRALQYARDACALTGWQHALACASLACAHAECNHFDKAIEWAKRALELPDLDPSQRPVVECDLKLFEHHMPNHEPHFFVEAAH